MPANTGIAGGNQRVAFFAGRPAPKVRPGQGFQGLACNAWFRIIQHQQNNDRSQLAEQVGAAPLLISVDTAKS
ncbi:hypothetical protein C1882_26025 [Pseudomonas sp. FW305-E2]|uniref:Uncharacterized protein n=1 Tax=Pseudomonas putida ND6 TaxID=231023 RepID=I3UT85_PSEPU|nr:hypothetical protein YSA_03594 [Pseudomonas putida ND6]POA81096.1 hypothetical protein C1882_26025 [Pseudomonas sp. FW305-E2]